MLPHAGCGMRGVVHTEFRSFVPRAFDAPVDERIDARPRLAEPPNLGEN